MESGRMTGFQFVGKATRLLTSAEVLFFFAPSRLSIRRAGALFDKLRADNPCPTYGPCSTVTTG
jgi:hypothetical protein